MTVQSTPSPSPCTIRCREREREREGERGRERERVRGERETENETETEKETDTERGERERGGGDIRICQAQVRALKAPAGPCHVPLARLICWAGRVLICRRGHLHADTEAIRMPYLG